LVETFCVKVFVIILRGYKFLYIRTSHWCLRRWSYSDSGPDTWRRPSWSVCADCVQEMESLIALSTVLNYNQSLKSLNVGRPIVHSVDEETTEHFANMLRVFTVLCLQLTLWRPLLL